MRSSLVHQCGLGALGRLLALDKIMSVPSDLSVMKEKPEVLGHHTQACCWAELATKLLLGQKTPEPQ